MKTHNSFHFNNFSEIIKSKGKMDNKGITFINAEKGDVFISYRVIYHQALKTLYFLQSSGVDPGNELVFQVDDNETLITFFWACILGGIIPVPVSIGNNDEHKHKVFRILKILTNPRLLSKAKNADELLSFAEKNNLCEIEYFKKQLVFIEENKNTEHFGEVYPSNIDDIAFIQFSSGSTGYPKGVMVTHKNLIFNTHAVNIATETNENDNLLSWMPLTHDMGLICFHLSSLAAGANQFIMPTSLFIRRPTEWMAKTSQYRATVLYSPNFGYKHFLAFFKGQRDKEWDLSSVRIILNGAEPISASLCNEFLDEMGMFKLKRNAMFPVYGLAEATVGVSSPPVGEEFKTIKLDRKSLNVGDKVRELDETVDNDSIILVNVGYPVNWCHVRICDNEDRVLEDDRVGHIQLSGESITCGYYNHKDKNGIFSSDGWLKTGDLGFMREGRLVITGRAKDIIFVNGQNYYPHDIEFLAEQVEGIELGKIAVCGVYDESIQNENVIAFVLYKGGIDAFMMLAKRIKTHILAQIGVDIQKVIPIRKMNKTTSGKVERYKLRERFLSGEFDEVLGKIESKESGFYTGNDQPGCMASNEAKRNDQPGCMASNEAKRNDQLANDVETTLLEICRQEFNNKKIEINSSFMEFGANSLVISKLHSRIDQVYPGQIAVADLYSYPSITKIAKILVSKKQCILEGIEFPAVYLSKGGTSCDTGLLKYTFPEHTCQKLSAISKAENVATFDVILSFFSYLFSSLSKKQSIVLYTLNPEEDKIYPLDIDISTQNSFAALIRCISTQRKQKQNKAGFSLNDWTSMIARNESEAIIPLFCEGQYRNTKVTLKEKFDLFFTIHQENNSLILTNEFNHVKLSTQNVKKLISTLIQVMDYATLESK